MNKTFKTVLITLAVVFVVLFAVVWIFGEDSPAVDDPSLTSSDSTTAPSIEETEGSSGNDQPALTKEEITVILNYDIFDWTPLDKQGRMKIAQSIITLWATKGVDNKVTSEELVGYINDNLYDQAIIFDVACEALQTDPSQFYE